MTKRIQKYEIDKSALEEEVKQLSSKSKNLAHQRISLQKQIAAKQQEMEILLRERNILARTKENLGDQIKRLNHEMLVCEYSRRKIEHELDSSIRDIQDVQLHLAVVEKERDKHNQIAQGLAREVSYYIIYYLFFNNFFLIKNIISMKKDNREIKYWNILYYIFRLKSKMRIYKYKVNGVVLLHQYDY